MWAQFRDPSTSSCIEEFAHVPCVRCDLPVDLRRLYCAMHEGVTDETLVPHHPLHDDAIVDAVRRMIEWRRDTPDWYADMLARVDEETPERPLPSFDTRDARATAVDVREAYYRLHRLEDTSERDRHYVVAPPAEDGRHVDDDQFQLIGSADDHSAMLTM